MAVKGQERKREKVVRRKRMFTSGGSDTVAGDVLLQRVEWMD